MTWVLTVGVVDFSLEQSIIIPALPALQAEYATSPTAVVWVITGFLLALAVATPVAGKLGDRYGHRRVLLLSLGAFAVGSLMCAVADSIGMVIAGRVVQGLGSGVGPLAVALVRNHLKPERVPRAIGIQIAAGGLGGAVGFVGGGLLTDYVSVQAIFWLLFATAAALAAAVALWVPESPSRSPVRVDWAGALLLAGALGAAMLAVSEGNEWGWGSAPVLLLLAGAAGLAAGFAARQLGAAEPLIDPAALSKPAVWGADLVTFAVGFALFTAYALVPLIGGYPEETGYGLGLTTTQIGLILLPGALGGMAGALASGRLAARVGGRNVTALGALCAGAGYLVFVAVDETVVTIMLGMVPIGLGTGLALAALVDLIALSVDRSQTGVNLGLNSVVRAVGAALGAAVAVAVVTGGDQLAPGLPAASAFTAAFALSAAATLAVAVTVALLPRPEEDPVVAVSG